MSYNAWLGSAAVACLIKVACCVPPTGPALEKLKGHVRYTSVTEMLSIWAACLECSVSAQLE